MRATIFILSFITALFAAAQKPDTLLAPVLDVTGQTAASSTRTTDSLFLETGISEPRHGLLWRVFSKNYPNPRTAAFLSLGLPGAGQIYNKRWWKLPLVYGALGATAYFEVKNYKQYAELRDNYKWVVDEDPNTNPTKSPYTELDATSLKKYRDQWRRYFEQTSLVLGLAYVLAATEAFVDAHLARFDVSDDLTWQIRPRAETAPFGNGIAFGIGVSLQFGANRVNRSAAPP